MKTMSSRIVKGVAGLGCCSVGGYLILELIRSGAPIPLTILPIITFAALGTTVGGSLLLKQAVKKGREQ